MEKVLHHPICRIRGGSFDKRHLMEVDKKRENKMHTHEGVRLFHEKLIHLIDFWHTNDVIKEVREEIRDIIQTVGPEMYEEHAVRDWRKIKWSFDKKGGIFIPKKYDEKHPEIYANH